jgi:hypothetical protein
MSHRTTLKTPSRRPELSGSGNTALWQVELVLIAALCSVAAAALIGWQWSRRQAAREALHQARIQLAAARKEALAAKGKLERMRATSERLERQLAQTNELAAWAVATAHEFEAWKRKTRRELTAADYRWSDASAFARIPKAVLPELSESTAKNPFSPPGVVSPYARELLGLDPAERQTLEDTLQRVAEIQRGPKADAYEWRKPASGRVLAASAFTAQPPGEVGTEAEQHLTEMLVEIRDVLGNERWPAMPSRVTQVDCERLNRMLIPEPAVPITASVELDDQGLPKARWTYVGEIPIPGGSPAPDGGNKNATGDAPAPASGKGNVVYSVNVVGYVNGNAALTDFLPGGAASQTQDVSRRVGSYAPEALRQRATSWFEEQAKVRMQRVE